VDRISVVIPTFNRIGTIQEAVDSALAQSLPPVEVIIVDDGSTDGTEQLFVGERRGMAFKKIAHSGLPSVARNVGIKMASGEFVAFLDSDDRWEPEHLRSRMEVLKKEKDVGLSCGNAKILDSNGTLLSGIASGRKSLNELLAGNFVVLSSAVVRRSVIERCGGFDEDPDLRAYEDYEFWIRLATRTDIHYNDHATVVYSDASPDSIRKDCSSEQDTQKLFQIFARAVKTSDQCEKNKKLALRQAVVEAHERLIRSRTSSALPQRLLAKAQIQFWKAMPITLGSELLLSAYASSPAYMKPATYPRL
jgi:glycosyltransferase involved in cell wall biosynthesis